MNRSRTVLFLCLVSLVWTLACRSVAQTSSSAGMKLHFPEEWHTADERPLDTLEQIEVRTLSNLPGEYFFAAVPSVYSYTYDSSGKARKLVYSENSYAVRLMPNLRVRAATKQEWESATRIATTGRSMFSSGSDLSSGEIEYRGKKFKKSGKYWQAGWLSPSGKWLAAFSYTGERTQDFFMDGGSVKNADIFWDVYDTASGEKIFEWRARNRKNPTVFGGPVVWLEERYFFFPQDEFKQDFTVVTLPEFTPETNPITIPLPSRMGANGVRVPAPANHPVWTPLVPLTKEQAAKLTAPQPPQLIEVRASGQASSRELLLGIREEIENSKRHQPAKGRESAQDYNYRLFSTYYYSISLDDPTKARFATREEWENSRTMQSRRAETSLEETGEFNDRQREEPFPKLGARPGGSFRSYVGQWTAVFSYTDQPGGGGAGKMFVEIFETGARNKFSSTEFPYTGSAVALFNRAVWIHGDYLLVPLNTSLDSFALWKLPGGA